MLKHANNNKITGIVLAGGKSSRFGTNKALFSYQGKELIVHVIDVLKSLCHHIIISTNHPDDFAFTGMETARDIHPDCGPVGGLHACLSQSSTDHNLIAGCDLPWLNRQLPEFILKNKNGYQVVMPVHQGLTETMVAYFHKSCTEELEKAILEKRYKVLDAIARLKCYFPDVAEQPFYSRQLFRNINHMDDLI